MPHFLHKEAYPMLMEMIQKLTETKAYLLLFLLSVSFFKANQIKEKNFSNDVAPGDNFPYLVEVIKCKYY